MAQFPKCVKCGWKAGKFHICLGLPKNVMEEVVGGPKRTKQGTDEKGPVEFSDAHRENISAAARERWARIHAEQRPRDLQIVARYKEGVSYPDVAKEFGINRTTALKILKRFEAEGLVEMRPANQTLRWSR